MGGFTDPPQEGMTQEIVCGYGVEDLQGRIAGKPLGRSTEPRLRLDADAIVHGSADSLFAAEISLGRLDRDVS